MSRVVVRVRALRFCLDCGLEAYTEEDLKLFANSKVSKYGVKNLCKKCVTERSKKWGETYPEKRKEQRDTYRERRNAVEKKNRKAYPFKAMLRRAKRRSREGGLPFDLTLEYLKQLWDDCGGTCPMWGVAMRKKSIYNNDNYVMSLDRIVREKGYVKGNVQIVSSWYNTAKGINSDEVTLERFRQVIERTHN